MKAIIEKSIIGWMIILVPEMKTMHITQTQYEAIDWCVVNGVEVVE